MKSILLLVAVSAAILWPRPAEARIPPKITPAATLPDSTPWDLHALSAAPDVRWLDDANGVRGLKYAGMKYKDAPTHVFAYYASPATITGRTDRSRPFPAVVLVHGGGGMAFAEWVRLWADRGYAAISMDLAGCGPDRKRMDDGGPNQSDAEKFDAIAEPVENQWPYHAVANVLLAHSLVLSLDEVDPDRTAVTGISWGGYLTCIVAGLDNRFKAAVPVYGCGFLRENSCWLPQFARMGPDNAAGWHDLWDPSRYVGSAAMPVFFINGTNDFAYPLDSYAKTYSLVATNGNTRITVNMPHSHPDGWAPAEIGLFIDQHLIGGKDLPRLARPRIARDRVRCRFTAAVAVASANLHYTCDAGPVNKLSWQTVGAEVRNNRIIAPAPPENARIWFLTATDERNATVSSQLVWPR